MEGGVSLELVQPSQRPLLEALMQFYFYDFSEMEPAGSDDFDFDGEGRFGAYPYMEDYWREEGRVPLLIRVGAKPAGFALINRFSHLGEAAVERNMGEFWVARKHRRHGVASEAVRQVLGAYRGRWEVAVVARNTAAQAFWPRAIAAAPNTTEIVRREGDGVRWRGPVWTFLAS